MKKIEVVAAIINFENEILCVQRPKNKLTYISEKFEFPGGKIEKGESTPLLLRLKLSFILTLIKRNSIIIGVFLASLLGLFL